MQLMASPSSPGHMSESNSLHSPSGPWDILVNNCDSGTVSRSSSFARASPSPPKSAPAHITDILPHVHRQLRSLSPKHIRSGDHGSSRNPPASTSPLPTLPGDGTTTVSMHFSRPSTSMSLRQASLPDHKSRSKPGPIAIDVKRLLSKPALPSSSPPTSIAFKVALADTETIQRPRAKKFLPSGPPVSANPSRESFLLRAASLPSNGRSRKGTKMHPVLKRRQNPGTTPLVAIPPNVPAEWKHAGDRAIPPKNHVMHDDKIREDHLQPKISSSVPIKKEIPNPSPSKTDVSLSHVPPRKRRVREQRNLSSDDEAGVYYTVLGQLNRQSFSEAPAVIVPDFRGTSEAVANRLGGSLARKLSGKPKRAASVGKEMALSSKHKSNAQQRRPRTLRRQRSLPSSISRGNSALSASAYPAGFRGLIRRISTGDLRNKSRNQASPPVPAFPAELSKDGRIIPTKFFSRLIHTNQSFPTRHLPQRKPIPVSPLPAAPAVASRTNRTHRRANTTPTSSSPFDSDNVSTPNLKKSHSTNSSTSSLGEEIPQAPISLMNKHIVPPAELYRLGLDSEGENLPLSANGPLVHRVDKGVYEILTPLPVPPRPPKTGTLVTEPDSDPFSPLDADDMWEKSISAVARHFESELKKSALADHSLRTDVRHDATLPSVPAKSPLRPNVSTHSSDADPPPPQRRVIRKKRSLALTDRPTSSMRLSTGNIVRPGSTWSDSEKAKRWDDLLELSAKAGGTLHLGLAESMNLDSDKMSLSFSPS
jgi:hypothetical protein